MQLPSNIPKYNPEQSTFIQFEDLFYSNEYHNKVVTFYATIFSTAKDEIVHAYADKFLLGCSDIHKSFNDYVKSYGVKMDRKPRNGIIAFMIQRGNKKNCFDVEIENNELNIFVYPSDDKRINTKLKKFKLSGFIRYIGAFSPENKTISLNTKLNEDDCYFHFYLTDISE